MSPDELSEHRFRVLVESVRDYAIFMIDPDGLITSWNPGAQRIKGYTATEVLGRHLSIFYTDEDRAQHKVEHELAVAAKEGRFEEEGWRVRKDGSRFWASVILSSIRDADGALVGFAKVTRDLTERREVEAERARAAAVETENRLKDEYLSRERAARRAAEEAQSSVATTLRSIGDGVLTTDERACVTLLNPVAEQLTGWHDAEARGKPLRSVFPIVNEQTRHEVENPVERVLREGVVVGLANHTVLVARDGRETPILDSAAPIRDASGTMGGVVLVFRDATRERRADRQRAFLVEVTKTLSSSLDYKETLAQVARIAVPDFADWCSVDVLEAGDELTTQVAVAHTDPARLALAREWAEKFPPAPDAERGAYHVIRTGLSELYPEVDEELLMRAATSEEHARFLRELHLHSALVVPITDGKRVRGAMTLAYSESSRRYGVDDVYLFEEVARRAGVALENARLYASEQQARQAAVAANQTKDEFLANVSHELRSPLNAILGWSQLLSRGDLVPEKRARAAETIGRNAQAMAQLVGDLLDVSRIISGKMRLELERVDILPVVDAAIESMRPAAEAKGVELSRRVGPELEQVLGDAARLQQIVWNLLSNAVKFTASGGKVKVALAKDGPNLSIVVSDDGKGISPAFLPHVFDPFRQAEGGVTRSTGGMGLGLAIVKHLVELHGGRVEASSEGEGKGATFTVRVPLVPTESSSAHGARGSKAAGEHLPQLQGITVLVVDDDDDAREVLALVLEGCAARVLSAASAKEAMRVLKDEVPDVLVSDIAMPGESGLDLIRQVRALPANRGGLIPAVALTAYARAEDRRRALGAGFVMHVAKPVEPNEIVTVVATLSRFALARAP